MNQNIISYKRNSFGAMTCCCCCCYIPELSIG